MEPKTTYTIITVEFSGKYWEGGNFDAETARIVYDRARKDSKIYQCQLMRWKPGDGWSLVASASKPIPPEWYQKRGIQDEFSL